MMDGSVNTLMETILMCLLHLSATIPIHKQILTTAGEIKELNPLLQLNT